MILTEYDEEFVMNALREECREEGLEEGRAEEREVGLRNLIEIIQELNGFKQDAESKVEQYWK